MKYPFSRRSFAKTFAGLSAGAATQFSGLFRDVFAQSAQAAPLRLLVITQTHGKSAFWRPRAPGGGAAAETGWTLAFDPDSDLGPLEKHKDSLVVMDGLDFYSLYKPGARGIVGGHVHTPALTGWDCRSDDDNRTKGPSIDVALASFLKVRPLIYEAGNGLTSFTATGDTAAPIEDVMQSYKDLFGNLTIAPPNSVPTMDPAAAARRNAEASVLKYLKDEATMLRGRLAGAERLKLDQHLEALHLMEQRLGAMGMAPPATCAKPAIPPLPGYEIDDDKPLKHKIIAEQIAAAFACNLTRVATFHMEIGNNAPFIDLGGASKHVHTDVVHVANPATPTDLRMRHVARVHRWHAQQASYLFDLLKAVPEAGGSVYDHTIVLWTNELGAGFGHTSWDVPFILAGGGGTWRKGRFLDYASPSTDKGFTAARINEKEAHNRLLVSVAKQFGVTSSTFGDPTLPGELPRLL